ncbi:HpcH/HpaI aldolase family protein [Nonomuraea rosea]|uniref:HpcH/HpaI aldolase family protein n=1 Tax=Nonomuraea rosea TaxID=638574 RepID=UPI0031ECB17C
MTERLNGVIKALEQGVTFTSFIQAEVESAVTFAQSANDGVVFELEHNPWDIRALREAMQFLLLRERVVRGNPVTPLVRIPPSGSEMNLWFAKQALDLGAFGIVWPRISTPEEAYNAVAACRYPPDGLRGDAPLAAARYWGLPQREYYKRADVWPLAPDGELLVVLMIEDRAAVNNLETILKEVPGIGVLLIGEGDLTQELGCPREYDNPELLRLMDHVLEVGKAYNVPVGHPHVNEDNVARVIEEGYRFLMTYPRRDFSALEKGRGLL